MIERRAKAQLRIPSAEQLFARMAGSSGAKLLAVVSIYSVVTVWRFAASSPPLVIGALYVIPIAILALTRGLKGGLAGVGLAFVLTGVWDALEPAVVLSAGHYLVRTAAGISVALVVGWQADRISSLEREAGRWLDISQELCCVANREGYLVRVNSAWTRVLGYSEEELLELPYIRLTHPDDVQVTEMEALDLAEGVEGSRFENRLRAKDGSWHWISWSSTSDSRWLYASGRDVTDRKEAETKVAALAHQDPLTGLANRQAWDSRVRDEIIRAERTGSPMCIAVLDLDNLRHVNDAQGHEAGDRLLRSAAACWSSALRDGDFIARLGGGEFSVILPDCTEPEASAVMARMAAAMPGGYSFSAGVARWDRRENPVGTIARANATLNAAKGAGRGCALLSSELDQSSPGVMPGTA